MTLAQTFLGLHRQGREIKEAEWPEYFSLLRALLPMFPWTRPLFHLVVLPFLQTVCLSAGTSWCQFADRSKALKLCLLLPNLRVFVLNENYFPGYFH